MSMLGPQTNLPENIRLFMADDDYDDCAIVKAVAKRSVPPATVTCVHTCEKLLLELKTAQPLPNLILLDINIPIMNGLECLKRIKLQPEYAAIAVIMYSTSNHPDHIAAAYRAGATRYFCKPVQFEFLEATLPYLINTYANGGTQPSREDFLLAEQKSLRDWYK